jgi:protein SCO1
MPAEQPSSPTPEQRVSDVAQNVNDVEQRAANNSALLKTFAAAALALVVSLAVLLAATGGGRSFTTESLRRQLISQQAERIEPFDVTLSNGQRTSLSAVLGADGTVWLVDFVYTRCATLCTALGSIYQQLQAQIETRGLQGKVGLLSISFDPTNDDAIALTDYARRMGLNPRVWQIVTLTNWQDRRRLLDAFGIMVLPAPLGEFEHNAALHVVTGNGMLTRIIDYNDFHTALDAAMAVASERRAAAAP